MATVGRLFSTVLVGSAKFNLPLRMRNVTRLIIPQFFWLNSKDEDSLKQSFARMARRILKEHPGVSRLRAINEDFAEISEFRERLTSYTFRFGRMSLPPYAKNEPISALDTMRLQLSSNYI